MGIYDRDYKPRITSTLSNNAVVQLIAINLVVFVLFKFIHVFYFFTYTQETAYLRFYEDFYRNMAIPGRFQDFIKKPWTLITHMFYHDEIWHIIGNMIWLWMFGSIFLTVSGFRRIIPLYIYGALGGALAFMVAYTFVPSLSYKLANATGASAGVMAIAVGTTILAPDYRIFPMLGGGIRLWVITLFYLVLDLALIPISNTGGHIAHLAGAFTGFLFIHYMKKGYEWSTPMNQFFDWVNNLFNPDKPVRKTRDQLFYKSRKKPFTTKPNITQQRIDEILDKINQNGYQSLTHDEKELLKKASKEDL